MAQTSDIAFPDKKPYPVTASVWMIVGAIILSFVDLAFLYDVIGKVLDLDATASLGIAFAIGLVGIGIMAHLGVKIAHGAESRLEIVNHYILWILLGMALVLIRIFSATIMQLNLSSGDEALMSIMGQDIRQVDVITAPLMLFLYIATGLMVKDGVKNLYLNPEFDEWRLNRKKAREAKKNKDEKREAAAIERMEKIRREEEERIAKQRELTEKNREQSALNGNYSNALAQFRAKENEVKLKYQQIAANIDYVQGIDKHEREFELKVKPGLMKIVNESIKSAQNSIALGLRKKTGEDITLLRNAIEAHNSRRHE